MTVGVNAGVFPSYDWETQPYLLAGHIAGVISHIQIICVMYNPDLKRSGD
jgi:hypothetical protein